MRRYGNPAPLPNAATCEVEYRVGASSIRCTTWVECIAAEVRLLSPRQRTEIRSALRNAPKRVRGRTMIQMADKFGVSVAAIKKVSGR